jgi:acetoin utilization protein AcuB
MNTFAPISSIMTSHLVTVNPEDSLAQVKQIFDTHTFHHLPVVRFREIVGMISRTDVDHFVGGAMHGEADADRFVENLRLQRAKAQDIMTKGLAKLEPDDRINVALEVFSINRFHALPVVRDGELVGIVTPFDVLRVLAQERPKAPHMVYDNPE